MGRIPLVILIGLLSGPLLFADVVTLKDGRRISGTVDSGNTQELHVKAGDQARTIDIHEVEAIQFGDSQAGTPSTPAQQRTADAPPAPNELIFQDGAHLAGRWWSLDAAKIHFLVGNQLRHFPRQDVLGVTFGKADLPSAPKQPSTPAISTPPPAAKTQATPAPEPPSVRPPSEAPPKTPGLNRPSSNNVTPAAPRVLSQPEEIGTVYFWNGKGLIALETNQAVEHRARSTEYWEIAAPRSRIRVPQSESLIFILRLPKEVSPTAYGLFVLESVNGSRRTRMEAGRRGSLLTWPVNVTINNESNLMTYAMTVRDLLPGEYSFSQSGSSDAYCFGVDPSAEGQ